MGETYELSKAQLAHMRERSPWQQVREFPLPPLKPTGNVQFDHARECIRAGRPITILSPEEIAARMPRPTEYTPPAKAKPLAIAMGLLSHELIVKEAPVAILVAKAAKFGVSESTLRRAKKALSVSTIERDDGYYWSLPASVEGS